MSPPAFQSTNPQRSFGLRVSEGGCSFGANILLRWTLISSTGVRGMSGVWPESTFRVNNGIAPGILGCDAIAPYAAD
jgi:hypothetical protein